MIGGIAGRRFQHCKPSLPVSVGCLRLIICNSFSVSEKPHCVHLSHGLRLIYRAAHHLARDIRKSRAHTGYIFQQFNLVNRLSVLENVLIGALGSTPFWRTCFSYFTREQKQRALQALTRVGMVHFAHQRVSTLSGGQQQRVAIARALMQQAKVILADEPIASLDPESARIVMDTLRDINQNDGITVVVTLHQVDYALRYCERIVALRQGHVFYDGCSQQFDNERFDHLYRSINRVEENAKAA